MTAAVPSLGLTLKATQCASFTSTVNGSADASNWMTTFIVPDSLNEAPPLLGRTVATRHEFDTKQVVVAAVKLADTLSCAGSLAESIKRANARIRYFFK